MHLQLKIKFNVRLNSELHENKIQDPAKEILKKMETILQHTEANIKQFKAFGYKYAFKTFEDL